MKIVYLTNSQLLNMEIIKKTIKLRKWITAELDSYWQGLLSFPYPNNCLICTNQLSDKNSKLCLLCLSELPFTFYEKDLKNSRVAEIFFGRVNIEYTYSMLFFESANSTQKLLHKLKYENDKELAKYLGRLIGSKLAQENSVTEFDYLLPVSLHSKKEFTRGYNQSELIAQGISEKIQCEVLSGYIKKKKNNQSQTKKNRQQRLDNVSGLFYIKNAGKLNKKHVALIDDVLTTGATLEAMANELIQNTTQTKVSIITLAFSK
ncbi:MAG: ComF family protein [Lishizhenia sp.]